MKFYECSVCGQIVGIVKDTRRPLTCCDEEMLHLVPMSVDASHEKHVPVYEVNGNTVEVVVGSDLHPMTASHYIEWIALETKLGNQEFIHQARKIMKSGDFMVVYCTVEKETAEERLTLHGETCPYDYAKAQKLYRDNVRRYYKPEKTLKLDTTNKSIDECVELIVEKLKEVQQGEL